MNFNYLVNYSNYNSQQNLDLDKIDWQQLASQFKAQNNHKLADKKSYYKIDNKSTGEPLFPNDIYLRKYQEKAVFNWLKNRGRGTLKMATGSGKTIIALAIACELYQQINLDILLVVCPFRHLVLQWSELAQKFNLIPILAFENVYNWQSQLSLELFNVSNKQQKFVTIITTNSTFMSNSFQSQLGYFSEKTLIIALSERTVMLSSLTHPRRALNVYV